MEARSLENADLGVVLGSLEIAQAIKARILLQPCRLDRLPKVLAPGMIDFPLS
jgi:hypothetical protein